MKYIIWGSGVRGKRILSRVNRNNVICFIDNDITKVNTFCEGKKIINFQEYLEKYSEYFILISMLRPEKVIEQLENRGIYKYFILSNCPSEFQMPGDWGNFDGYLKGQIDNKSYGIGIYGTTFFSVYLYELLKNIGKKNIVLLPEKNCNSRRWQELKKVFNCADDINDTVQLIFMTENIINWKLVLHEQFGKKLDNIEVKDVFDNLKKRKEYYNADLKQFKDIHKGERCFIVATGPSLRMADLDILKKNNVISIGMNRIFLAYENTSWRPEYYVCGDSHAIEADGDTIKKMGVKAEFIGDSYPDFWMDDIPGQIHKLHFHLASVFGEQTRFSEEISYGVYCSETVTYACMQVAAYMGFTEIYLLGVDYNFSNNYKDVSNHFSPKYYNKDSKTNSFNKEETLQAYLKAKQYAETHGIKIYNATRGGKLEVFERVDFDSLFEKGEQD